MRRQLPIYLMVFAAMFRLSRSFRGPVLLSPRQLSLRHIHPDERRSYSRSAVVCASRKRKKEHHYKLDMNSEDNWDAWEFGQDRPLVEEDGSDSEGSTSSISEETRRQQQEEDEAASQVPSADIHRATAALARFCTEDRLKRLNSILGMRTRHIRFAFENPSNPNNIWACLRTLDSFGIQYADIICDPSHYRKAHRLFSMQSAVGAQKWLSLTEHATAKECVEKLRGEGYRIVAADLAPGTTPKLVQAVDWGESPVVVVMGNEERGITQEMRDLCDFTFQLPMVGFSESYNLSVSVAITLAYISSLGGIKYGDLDADERDKLMLRWVMKSVRGSAAILRREGLIHSAEGVMEAKESILGFKIK